MTTLKPAPLVCPEIVASDLEAVRRFLNADRDASTSTPAPALSRTSNVVRDRKGPTVHNGITRARFRSAAKTG